MSIEEESEIFPIGKITQQSCKAITALQSHLKKEGKKDQLLAQEYIFLVLSLKKIAAKATSKPYRLSIPFPWRSPEDPSLSVCLITKDSLSEQEKANMPSLPCLRYVETVKELANKHKPFEAKRMLCASHDLFLADDRVLPMLPKILGKTFFAKKKHPVPVSFNRKDIKEELESAIKATFLHLNTGPCITIKVGKTCQLVDNIQANIEAVLKQIDKRLPEGGLTNIRNISVKAGDSISLPIFECPL